MTEKNELRPTEAEKEFLTLTYNRFYDLFEEIMTDLFWEKEPVYRLSRIKDVFGIYAELLNYEPIKWVIEHLKKARSPMEAEIGSEFLNLSEILLRIFVSLKNGMTFG